MAAPQNLLQLLSAAADSNPNSGLLIYNPSPTRHPSAIATGDNDERSSTYITYASLLGQAQRSSSAMQGLLSLHGNKIVLLHTDNHEEGIRWFWAIVAAGGIPCMSTPFSKDNEQRKKHIQMLQSLLNNPTMLTSEDLVHEFDGVEDILLWTFGQVQSSEERLASHAEPSDCYPGNTKIESDLAVLMLTSGSTGNAKAVCLKHGQILEAVRGKSEIHGTRPTDTFLNWTGLDHVAHLTEIHLHAISLGANQILIPGQDVLADPLSFLELVDKHKVSYTFAPNFFLGILVQKLMLYKTRSTGRFTSTRCLSESNKSSMKLNDVSLGTEGKGKSELDLSCLRALISGGESNIVDTCVALTGLLQPHGAARSFIRPGFGMTETCAGAIYNAIDCPDYDVVRNLEFACLGSAIRGVSMRIVNPDGVTARGNEIGELQVQGPVVFSKYFNNPSSTTECWTNDGWFRTGDRGYLDDNGRLHLTGRDKDIVIVNGVNHHPQAIEAAVEHAKIPGLKPCFTAVFAHRPRGSDTEVLVVVYLPTYKLNDGLARVDAAAAISKAIVTYCGVRPFKIIPLDSSQLQRSSLGKLSRSKLRNSFEDGMYDTYISQDSGIIARYKASYSEPASTATEQVILEIYTTMFGNTGYAVGVNQDLFALGVSSIDLLKLRVALQKCLKIPSIPITLFFSHPIVRDLAVEIEGLQQIAQYTRMSFVPTPVTEKKGDYNPVVVLQPNGSKAPIWFIHPGVGEVLIFMNLSRYITDRPVYALRARGFDGESYFTSMSTIINTYLSSVKRIQPHGPYSFTGYSFGSILAFEMTKILESEGEEVRFLATLDQPPRFKERSRGYDWHECVLTLAFFLHLIPENYAYSILPSMRARPQHEVLDHIFSLAPVDVVQSLGMTPAKLENWANLALELKKCTWQYDPAGRVKCMDVFYTEPLVGIVKAKTMKEWFDGYIGVWGEFVDDVKFHEVKGTHRTMINPPNLVGFWKVLSKAMAERGV